jgi:hypothetical protein
MRQSLHSVPSRVAVVLDFRRSSGLYAFPHRVFLSGLDSSWDASDIARCGLFPPRSRKIQTGALSVLNLAHRSCVGGDIECLRMSRLKGREKGLRFGFDVLKLLSLMGIF